jgi:threonine dehydrogenase-like Zn-dependent dehydrogenase
LTAAWQVSRPGAPPALVHEDPLWPGPNEVCIDVAACLLDPTDAGLAGNAARGAVFPLVPGRHVAGRVAVAGNEAGGWVGRPVLVPELLPCGSCAACRRALPLHCPLIVRPGVTHPGGLTRRLRVPARFIVPLDGALAWNRPLRQAAAIGRFALAYQAVALSGAGAGDVAVARDEALALLRLKGTREAGADARIVGPRLLVPAGDAFDSSIGPGSTIVVYGDPPTAELPAAGLLAAEATVRFVRGCHPDLYPELLAIARRGELDLAVPGFPFERADQALRRCTGGPVLVDFD